MNPNAVRDEVLSQFQMPEDEAFLGSLSWTYIEQFPIKKLLGVHGLKTPAEWAEYSQNHAPGAELQGVEELDNPIIITVDSNGRLDIWDGMHRTGEFFYQGRDTIPAFVGVENFREEINAIRRRAGIAEE